MKEQAQQLYEKWTKFYTQYLAELKEQGWVWEWGKGNLVIGVLHYHDEEEGVRIDRAVELWPGYGIVLPGFFTTNGCTATAAKEVVNSLEWYPDKYEWEDLLSDEGELGAAPRIHCKDCKPENAGITMCYGSAVVCCVCGKKQTKM